MRKLLGLFTSPISIGSTTEESYLLNKYSEYTLLFHKQQLVITSQPIKK